MRIFHNMFAGAPNSYKTKASAARSGSVKPSVIPEATQPLGSVEIPFTVSDPGAVYGPFKNVLSVVLEGRNTNGTAAQELPETLVSIIDCDRRLALLRWRVSSARSWPMLATIEREPPPLKHTATFPGVSVEINELTDNGGAKRLAL
jgi:hypothetical protein